MIDDQPATVAELWRYPVKSMRGERVEASDAANAGFTGDREYAVIDPATHKVGSAKHPRLWGALLQCRARYLQEPRAGAPPAPVSITLPDGEETGSEDPDVDKRLSAVFGRPVQLTTVAPEGNGYLAVWPEFDGVMPDDVREQSAVEGAEPDGTLTDMALALASPPGTFFDVAALHVLTTATLRRLGELEPGSRFAVERYRPNIVIDALCEPFAENGWSGADARFGGALSASVLIPTMRCIMTTLAQGELPRDNNVLRTLTRHNRIEIPGLGTWSCVGAYAAVTTPGRIEVGDEVALSHPS
jgi:MOSC domain-containing protein